MNSKGQEAYVFRLLIGAVIGIIIFSIIFVLIDKTEKNKKYLSDESFITAIKQAVKSPIDENFVIKNVHFDKDTYISKDFLSEITSLSRNSFNFNTNSPVIEINNNGVVHIKKKIVIDVIINCHEDNSLEICDIYFGGS